MEYPDGVRVGPEAVTVMPANKPSKNGDAAQPKQAPGNEPRSLRNILTTRIEFNLPRFGLIDAKSPESRRLARLDALQSEMQALVSAPAPGAVDSSSTWVSQLFGQGPFAVIKRKTERFRLPRALKTDLINRFTSNSSDALSRLTTMIVVAHPDDESIGAGARLRRLGDAYVVDVTDGAPDDMDCVRRHGFETREAYAAARQSELEAAMMVAGLPPDRLIALGFIDGEATLRLVELCMRVTELIDSIHPEVVLTHPYEGGHTDHDATAFAVHLACGILRREGMRPPAVLEFPSYHAREGEKVVQEFLPHERADRGQRVVALSEEDRALKRQMFDSFGSQRDVIGRFSTEFERFRPAPRYLFTRPPHKGQLNYERYGNPDRGKAWREQALAALRSLKMRRD